MNKKFLSIKNEKGSVTIFVLVGLLFMASFLILSYGSNINKSKIAKEQFNIISDIYSYKDGDAYAYNRAYTDLRKNNIQTLTASVTRNSTLQLTRTFERDLVNYQIYGSMGTQITIKVINENNKENKEYKINLSSALQTNEYIDYKTQSVLYADGTLKESVSLPNISVYEDYAKIQVTSGGTPSKIVVEYIGYTL